MNIHVVFMQVLFILYMLYIYFRIATALIGYFYSFEHIGLLIVPFPK